MANYVAYYRVSTAAQGRSGLGLGAQKAQVAEFLCSGDELVAEYVEVQSGKSDARVELWRAIAHAKRVSAKLLIAKLDRFSRRVSFIANLMEQGVGLVVADMPNASDFQLHIFAALAQEERRLISDRTRKALAEAKRRGVRLGKNGRTLAVQNQLAATRRANMLAPIIVPLVEQGQSYSAIARCLNDMGVQTARGGKFFPESAKAVIRRLNMEKTEQCSMKGSEM